MYLDYLRKLNSLGRASKHENPAHKEETQPRTFYCEATPHLETSRQNLFCLAFFSLFTHSGWICIHGNSQALERLTTRTYNYLYSPIPLLAFFSYSHTFSRITGERKKFDKYDRVDRVRTIQYLLLHYWQERESFRERVKPELENRHHELNIFELFHTVWIYSMHYCSLIQSSKL